MTDLDQAVVTKAKGGDQDACRTIIEALHRPVIATIYRFLGPRFHSQVEDIAQDIFLKVFRSIDRFDPRRGVKFNTWVYTFVRNHCFDVLKKRRLATTSLTVGAEDGGQWDIPDGGAAPTSAAENNELGRKIGEALEALGEEQRMAFVLREYEGLEYAVIAEVMGVSEGTVKSRLHRAKQSLRNRLSPYVRIGS